MGVRQNADRRVVMHREVPASWPPLPEEFVHWLHDHDLAIGQAIASEVPTVDEPDARELDFRAGRLALQRALMAFGASVTIAAPSSYGLELGAELAGSLSHSEGRAIAIVGARRLLLAVGVDLESRRLPLAALHLLANQKERTWLLAGSTEEEQELRLLTLFSSKESVYKAWSAFTRRERMSLAWIDVDVEAGRVRASGVPGAWSLVSVRLNGGESILTGAVAVRLEADRD